MGVPVSSMQAFVSTNIIVYTWKLSAMNNS